MLTKILAVAMYMKDPTPVRKLFNHGGLVMFGDAFFASAFALFLVQTA